MKDNDPFGNLVIDAWCFTTRPQRELALEDWESGRARYYKDIAELLHIDAGALLLACMLEFGHPWVCKPSGRPKDNHYGRLYSLLVDKSAFSVDKPVDKSVEKAVDKSCPGDKKRNIPRVSTDFSTGVENFAYFSTDTCG